MAIFKQHFPSRQEFGRLVLVTAFPVHFWAIIQFLRHLPALMLHLRPAAIWDVLSYVLGGAFIETVLTAAALTLLAAILPRKLLRAHFLPAASLVVYISAGWAVLFHYAVEITNALTALFAQADFLSVYLYVLGGIMIGYFATVFLVPHLAHTRPGLRRAMEEFAERVEVLSWIFLLADAAGIVTVVLRNLLLSAP